MSWDRWRLGHLCGSDNAPVLSVCRYDYGGVLLFLRPSGHSVALADAGVL